MTPEEVFASMQPRDDLPEATETAWQAAALDEECVEFYSTLASGTRLYQLSGKVTPRMAQEMQVRMDARLAARQKLPGAIKALIENNLLFDNADEITGWIMEAVTAAAMQ